MTNHQSEVDSNRPFVAFYEGERPSWSNGGVEAWRLESAGAFTSAKPVVKNTIYIRHPLKHHQLVAPADYDLELVKAKSKVATEALQYLGATRVQLFSFSGSSEEYLASIKAGMPSKDAVGVSAGTSKSNGWSLYADWTAAGSEPRDPRPLELSDIDGLEAICFGVLYNGVTEWKQLVHASSSLALDASVSPEIKGMGLNFNVDAKKQRTNILYFDVTFRGQATVKGSR